jgi:hypothetical protein
VATITTDGEGEWVSFDLPPFEREAGDYTLFYLESPGSDIDNCARIRRDTSSPTYSDGRYIYSNNSGGSWANTQGTDALFRLFKGEYTEGSTAYDISVSHPCIKTLKHKRNSTYIKQWENMSLFQNDFTTELLVDNAIPGDVIELTTLPGLSFVFKVG